MTNSNDIIGIRESVSEDLIDLEDGVGIHLGYNFDPPFDEAFVVTAIRAIQAVDEGAGNRWIDLPFPEGHQLSADDVIKWMKLEIFLGLEK
jgi:hypothetical protein